jgi:hypothetical protein
MKYIKLFEQKDELKIGDYVICAAMDEEDDESTLNDYLKYNIGRFIGIKPLKMKKSRDAYIVKFDKVPSDIQAEFGSGTDNNDEIFFDRFEIIDFSKHKEDLEHFIQANKYNL